jgi:membrane-associated phospholipid phosphatase
MKDIKQKNSKNNNGLLGIIKLFLHDLPENIKACFRLGVLPWHLLAFFLTAVFVLSGFDWAYYVATRQQNLRPLFAPALALGSVLPMIAPLLLYAGGVVRKNVKMLYLAGVMGQSALLGLLFSFFYKSFTGRMQPRFLGANSMLDISHGFRFGFLRGGVFWGWPSSHTTVAFAVAMALVAFFPKNRIVRYIAPLFALYIGIGVATVGIHWFSEFVAGAIFGTIVGFIVGKSFRKYMEKNGVS